MYRAGSRYGGWGDYFCSRYDASFPAIINADLLAFTAGSAGDGDTRDMLQRVRNVGIREAPQLLGVDGILDYQGVLLVFQRPLKAAAQTGDDDLFQLLLGFVGGSRGGGRVGEELVGELASECDRYGSVSVCFG